jgi:ATP-dependent DNA ligase
MVFYAFDLLFLEGLDLRKSPQIERKRVLRMLFDETKLKALSCIATISSQTGTRCMPTPAS